MEEQERGFVINKYKDHQMLKDILFEFGNIKNHHGVILVDAGMPDVDFDIACINAIHETPLIYDLELTKNKAEINDVSSITNPHKFAVIVGSGCNLSMSDIIDTCNNFGLLQTQSIPIFNPLEHAFDDCNLLSYSEDDYKFQNKKASKDMVCKLSRNFVSKMKPSRYTHPVRRVKIPKN